MDRLCGYGVMCKTSGMLWSDSYCQSGQHLQPVPGLVGCLPRSAPSAVA